MPRPLKEQALQVWRTADQLQQSLGRSPTITDLAERLQVARKDEVLEALAVAHSQEPSLDHPVGTTRRSVSVT